MILAERSVPNIFLSERTRRSSPHEGLVRISLEKNINDLYKFVRKRRSGTHISRR
jgi:hypothetical protein